MERLLEKHGAALLDRAIERFDRSDAVLSALLNFWAARTVAAAGTTALQTNCAE